MKYGICVCGLNGSGKTTLADALAKEIGYKHMDAEDYYFKPSDAPYSSSRTRADAEQLLLEDIKRHPHFVFSAVNGDMNAEINSYYSLVVYLDVPLDIRMERIRKRSADKFGDRILPGGDMHEQEEKFFQFVRKRTSAVVEAWLNSLDCKVIRLDGTSSVRDNICVITAEIQHGIEMPRKHNKDIVPTARMLRKSMTKEEKHLWYDFLSGYNVRFTRQKVLGKYIADFYCAKARLVIELDGSGHYTEEGIEHDRERTAFLRGYGLEVIRIPNKQIKRNFKGVCSYIDRIVEERL